MFEVSLYTGGVQPKRHLSDTLLRRTRYRTCCFDRVCTIQLSEQTRKLTLYSTMVNVFETLAIMSSNVALVPVSLTRPEFCEARGLHCKVSRNLSTRKAHSDALVVHTEVLIEVILLGFGHRQSRREPVRLRVCHPRNTYSPVFSALLSFFVHAYLFLSVPYLQLSDLVSPRRR